jgi:hypothetical protein
MRERYFASGRYIPDDHGHHVAFFAADAFGITAQSLVTRGADLDDLVLHDQFTIGFDC